jgi:hypothetical protein
MTYKEFSKIGFTGGMILRAGEATYEIISVDFEESTVFVDDGTCNMLEFTLDEIDEITVDSSNMSMNSSAL